MPSNADPIVAQIQQDMQALMTYVTGPETATQTAYTVELTLFRRLLALEAALLRLFFLTRAASRPAAPRAADGSVLDYHHQRLITSVSMFGTLRFPRHYFVAPGHAGFCPVDRGCILLLSVFTRIPPWQSQTIPFPTPTVRCITRRQAQPRPDGHILRLWQANAIAF